MTNSINKIGIIQTAPLPGDFSNNLRAIVQGYRECLEHGADIVIAPAAALCGLEPGHLAMRHSFLSQTQLALDSLSKELGTAPLFLAAFAQTISNEEVYVGVVGEDDADSDPWMENERSIVMVPYMVEKNCVTELEENRNFNIMGSEVRIFLSNEEQLPDESSDLIIHMPVTPWFVGSIADDAELCSWEANLIGCTVACVRPVGTIGGNIYCGGSSVFNNTGDQRAQLPMFEAAAKVVNVTRPAQLPRQMDNTEQLSAALQRGLRDNVRNNCFSGVCIPMDHTNSPLLVALAIEALGAGNVCGISFNKENKLAEKAGISCFYPQTSQLEEAALACVGEEDAAALRERMHTAIALTHAESRGLMLCCTLGRREIMLGDFRMCGLSGGHIAPLGNLYDIDIFLLSERLKEQYPDLFGALATPPHGTTNRIIHELADMNTPPSELLHEEMNYLFKENDVRLIQRKIVASAIKRTQLPIILHADAPTEQLHFPISHRLND